MFMNVITGILTTFIVYQGHRFSSNSCQGQTNLAKCVCCHVP